jgi:hypothetical protein
MKYYISYEIFNTLPVRKKSYWRDQGVLETSGTWGLKNCVIVTSSFPFWIVFSKNSSLLITCIHGNWQFWMVKGLNTLQEAESQVYFQIHYFKVWRCSGVQSNVSFMIQRRLIHQALPTETLVTWGLPVVTAKGNSVKMLKKMRRSQRIWLFTNFIYCNIIFFISDYW